MPEPSAPPAPEPSPSPEGEASPSPEPSPAEDAAATLLEKLPTFGDIEEVDLTTLTGAALPVAFGALAVACLGKLIGGGLGARLGGLPTWQAAAVGSGLNARGAMELVIAAIGLSIGVLTAPMYAIIVMIAVVTSLMAVPLLRFCVRRQGFVNPAERSPAPSKEEVRI